MHQQLTKVGHFMEDFGQTIRYDPVTTLSQRERYLKIALLTEELTELATHFGVKLSVHIDPHVEATTLTPADLLKHLSDLTYVLFGTVCTVGLQPYLEAGFEAVHNSNMTKRQLDGTVKKNSVGKVIKPVTYRKPDFLEVMNAVRRQLENTP